MKNKKPIIIKRLSFLIAVMLGINNCNTLTQGVIIEKWYESPNLKKFNIEETTIFQNKLYRNNVNYQVKDGEDFCIRIKGLEPQKRETFRTIYLRRECWDSAYVGMLFCISGNCFTYDYTWDKVAENSLVD